MSVGRQVSAQADGTYLKQVHVTGCWIVHTLAPVFLLSSMCISTAVELHSKRNAQLPASARRPATLKMHSNTALPLVGKGAFLQN
jgi:hypothetical protein